MNNLPSPYGLRELCLRATETGVETYYAADGSGVIAEFQTLTSSSWQWKKNYIKWGDRLVATETADGLQYQHPDRLGTKLITNASGGVITEQAHLPFGTALPLTSTAGSGEGSQSSSQPNPHQRRFTSYERSTTTNLDYAVNRHYAAEQGRFTQVDPIGMAAVSLENPQTLNLYAYCANDPVNHTDPSGLLPKWLKKLFKVLMWALMVISAINAVFAAFNAIAAVVGGGLKALGKTAFRGLMNLVSKVAKAVSSVADLFKNGKTISRWAGLIGDITDFLGDKDNIKSWWKWFKVVHGTASKIAALSSHSRATAVLGVIGLASTIKDFMDNYYPTNLGDGFTVKQYKFWFFGMKTIKMISFEGKSPFNKHILSLLDVINRITKSPPFGVGVVIYGLLLGVTAYEQSLAAIDKFKSLRKAFSSPRQALLPSIYRGGANETV
jgi:RHS repeat-associated protein